MFKSNRSYYMKGNAGNETPGHVISIGIHSVQTDDPVPNSPVCGHLTLGSYYVVSDRWCKGKWYGHAEFGGNDTLALWNWIRAEIRPGKPAWIFANDWHAATVLTEFWRELDSLRFKLSLPDRAGTTKAGKPRTIKGWQGFVALERRPFVIFAACPRGVVKLVDVNNYFEQTNEQLADSLRVEPPGIAECLAGSPESMLYSERSARIVQSLMCGTIDAWRRENRGNWQPTAGRLAWSNWRHEFYAGNEIATNDDKMDRPFHRSAYFGGEATCFAKGFHNGPFYKVDVTGLYPAVMRTGWFPRRVNQHHPASSMVGRTRPLQPGQCIASVWVECLGQVPVRQQNGRVCYPAGVYHTTLAGPELEKADREHRIREWYGWTWFDGGNIFGRFVAYWQTIRDQAKETSNQAEAGLAKLILNSLSGRFGMMSPTWTLDQRFPPPVRWGQYLAPDPESGRFCKWRSLAGTVQREGPRVEKDDTFPAISAFITAYGREYMRLVRSILPSKSCLVQQTDSLILTEAGLEALQNSEFWGPGLLGKFREVDTFYHLDIMAANQYVHSHGECLAGCPEQRTKIEANRWTATRNQTVADYIANSAGSRSLSQMRCEFILNPEPNGKSYNADGWEKQYMSVRGLDGDLEPAPF